MLYEGSATRAVEGGKTGRLAIFNTSFYLQT